MKKDVSRRVFLTGLLRGSGSIIFSHFLASCNQALPNLSPTASQTSVATPLRKVTPLEILPTPSNPEAGPTKVSKSNAYLSVARGGSPEALVRNAIASLGGMGLFVPKNSFVIIKPNICSIRSYEYAATTNPWVVGTLVKLCFEAGAARVQVMDFPFDGQPDETYSVSGIREQVLTNGGEMALMPRFKFVETGIPNGKSLKSSKVYDDVLKADVLINVPIAKDHGLARLTLGMKNLMGVVQDRQIFHRNLGQNLADLMTIVRPTLTVIDAVRILMANGPTGGNLDDVKPMDTVIASADPIAADSYASTLFGLQPNDLDYILCGFEMGLGRSDLNNLKIEEISIGA